MVVHKLCRSGMVRMVWLFDLAMLGASAAAVLLGLAARPSIVAAAEVPASLVALWWRQCSGFHCSSAPGGGAVLIVLHAVVLYRVTQSVSRH